MVLSGCWRLSCRLSPGSTKMNLKPFTLRLSCWKTTSRRSRRYWTTHHLCHRRLRWSTASSRRSHGSPTTTWWEILLLHTTQTDFSTTSDPSCCLVFRLFVGPQGAGGETGEEREETEEAAQDLHEESSGVRRYEQLFTSAACTQFMCCRWPMLTLSLPLQLLRRLQLRAAGPNMNWVVRSPSRGKRKTSRGCWSTTTRMKPCCSKLLSQVSLHSPSSQYIHAVIYSKEA